MQHESRCLPVTALAFFRDYIILAAEGNDLKIYNVQSGLALVTFNVFDTERIHGILVDDDNNILVWGGSRLRPLQLRSCASGDTFDVVAQHVLDAGDWILDAACAIRGQTPGVDYALVTAHNALLKVTLSGEGNQQTACLEQAIPGSNCILYSAHVSWLSQDRWLIASGTAFGDVVLWSAIITGQGNKDPVESQVHYSFSAHEGSVFGVQISTFADVHQLGSLRMLATCSDDRTIRLWDISDLTQSPDQSRNLEKATGFQPENLESGSHPTCLAKIMGHLSRIWHVRFSLHSDSASAPIQTAVNVLSFGEDASVNHWQLRKCTTGTPDLRCALVHLRSETLHTGKNIWSLALRTRSQQLLTGGADGAIVLRSVTSYDNSPMEIPRGPLQSGGDQRESFKAYCFIKPGTLVSTTDQGNMALIHLQSKCDVTISKIADHLPGLRGGSIARSVPGLAVFGGMDGSVYAFRDGAQSPILIANTGSKIAGVFVSDCSVGTVDILVTSISQKRPALLMRLRDKSLGARGPSETPFASHGLDLPLGFVITSFASTGDLQSTRIALGSRSGSLLFYDLTDNSNEAFVSSPRLYTNVHGKEAITDMHWHSRVSLCDPIFLYTTGRDGTMAVHQLRGEGDKVGLHLVHQSSLPFGPNVEGMAMSAHGSLLIWGFKSKRFVVFDMSAQSMKVDIECGGANRSWAFQPEQNGTFFVWTKASRLYWHSQADETRLAINSGGHGREIKAVAVSALFDSEQQLIATGAEDTDIKLHSISGDSFNCLHTLRKHNTGVQQLLWNGRYLFSSGGFEEFFVWRVQSKVPVLTFGVVCESAHPHSGQSDLRVLGFDVRCLSNSVRRGQSLQDEECDFMITMAYSDSSLKVWHYFNKTWQLTSQGHYLTSCLTHIVHGEQESRDIMTLASDGHMAHWNAAARLGELSWSARWAIHQSAMHSFATNDRILATGGDDNAIALTLLRPKKHPATLIVTRCHAAAITGLVLTPIHHGKCFLISGSIDQRVSIWEIAGDWNGVGIDDLVVRRVQSVFTPVADVSGLELCRLYDGSTGLLVCGVGMELWRLPKVVQDVIATQG